jgi:ectoine hydroxylase-related dioxygenase (phytanoyl-CoA dioxygenase family)
MEAAVETVESPNNLWTADLPWIDRDDADIDAYVSSLPKQPDYDLRGYLKRWRDRGLVTFEGVVDTRLIDRMLEDIDHFMRNFDQYRLPIEVRGEQTSSDKMSAFPQDMAGVKINHLHCFSKAAARLSLTPQVVDFLSHLFRGPASVCQSLTFWRGSEQPIHIDYPYVRQQTKLSYLAASWTPLEDIHPDSGPLGYYPGGHKPGASGFFDWGGGSIIQDENSTRTPMDFAYFLWDRMAKAGLSREDFCPRRGDVLIWHGNLPHEGTKVANPGLTRKSYVTHYTAEATLPDWMRAFDKMGRPSGVFENGAYSYRYAWFDGYKCLPSWA